MRKSVLSVLLSASLVMGLMPVEGLGQSASAAEVAETIVDLGTITTWDVTNGESGVLSSVEDPAKATFNTATGELTIQYDDIETIGRLADYSSSATTPWSEYKDAIKKVTVTGNIINIGNYSFYNNYSNLAEIDISNSKVERIGDYAFYNSGLTTITGSENLTKLGSVALAKTKLKQVMMDKLLSGDFQECTELESVSLPAFTSETTSNMFSGCTSLKTVSMNSLKAVTADDMFNGCTSLKTVSMNSLETVKQSLSKGMFYNCTALESISLPSLTTVEGNFQYSWDAQKAMFYNCTALKTVNLPKLETVKNYMFYNTALTSLNLSAVTTIEQNAFSNTRLGYLDLPATAALTSLDTYGASNLQRIYYRATPEADVTGSLGSNVTVYVPSGTKDHFTSVVTNPETQIIEMGTEDFDTQIAKEIGVELSSQKTEAAFEDLETWKSGNTIKVFDASGENISIDAANISYEYYTDQNCTTPANGADADSTEALKNPGSYYVRVKINETDANVAAISNTVQLTLTGEIKPDDATWGYHNGTNTLTIYDKTVVEQDYESSSSVPWSSYKGSITTIKFEEGVEPTKLGNNVFANSSNLTTFDIPGSVREIGTQAFQWCGKWEYTGNLTLSAVGTKAFYFCSKFNANITLSDGVTEVRDGFTYSGITAINMPASVTTIAEGAFNNCSELTSAVISEKITTTPAKAFNNCKKLETIDLKNVTELGNSTFSGCSALKSITMPKVTTMGTLAFYGCSALETVDLSSVTSIGNNAFNSCTSLKTVNLLNLEAIPESAFNSCSALTSVNMPKVTSIGSNAFNSCSALTKLDLSKIEIWPGTETSTSAVFNNCSSLTEVKLPELTSFGNSFFSGCKALEEITIPATVTTFGDSVFQDSGIKKCIIPATVTSIGKQTFQGCANLEYVEFVSEEYTATTMTTNKTTSGSSQRGDGRFQGVSANIVVIASGGMIVEK